MNERMHGAAMRQMRGWVVEGVWEKASEISMVERAVILGRVVYRCTEVEREK